MPAEYLDRREVERMIEDAVERAVAAQREQTRELIAVAVAETLTRLGVAADEPLEMQKDFQHLRDWRRAGEDIRSKGILTLVGITVTGGAAALWLGIRAYLEKGP